MSANIPTHFVNQYSTSLELLTQQVRSKLEAFVDSGMHEGEKASPVDQYGQIEALENTERFSEMPRVDAPADRRWVLPTDFDLPQLVSQKDLLKTLTDPKAVLARDAVAAFNRKKDLVILQGLLGTNQTGKDGTTATILPTSQSVSVQVGGALSKLNVAKLREAKRILMANDVDVSSEELYIAVNAAAHDALLNEIQIVSTDYNVNKDGAPLMREGLIDRFLGINFVHCERVFTGTDDQGGTSFQCPVWAKSGAYLGKWKDINTRVDERKDLRDIPWQIYTRMSIGATRKDEKKVVRIWSR